MKKTIEARRETSPYREINSWKEFQEALEEVTRELTNQRRKEKGLYTEPILFRGLPNAEWDLKTTLELRSEECVTLPDYMRRALRHSEEICAITGQSWDLPPTPGLIDEINANSTMMRIAWPRTVYAYLVYLRQYGFSSPLLDWTRSPFVAAYFAFRNIQPGTDRVVIYAYSERPNGAKGFGGSERFIQVWGPFTATRPRHFVQQASYTIAVTRDPKTKRHTFCSHKDVISAGQGQQDRLGAISLPASMRTEALARLHEVNINDYTLFGTEESLLKTIDTRVFDLGL